MTMMMMIDNDSDVWIQCKNSIWRVLSPALQIHIGCTMCYTLTHTHIRSAVWAYVGFVMKQRAKQWRLNKFKSRFSFLGSLFHPHSYARTHTPTCSLSHSNSAVISRSLSERIPEKVESVWTSLYWFFSLSLAALSMYVCVRAEFR